MRSKTIQISATVEKELERLPRWKLMFYLQERGEASAYQIAKDLNWTTGKAHAVVKSLMKSGAVKAKTLIQNNRVVRLVRLTD